MNGGTVSNGKITWKDTEDLAVGESRSITYTMRVNSDMPLGTTNIKNTASSEVGPWKLTDSWNVTVTVNNPTPVTGIELGILAMLALLALAGSVVLRIAARRA